MNTQPTSASQRNVLQQKYNTARINLLLMIGFTVLNVILFIVGADIMMLFSATVPYYAMIFGIVFEDPIFLVFCIVIAAVSVLAYLLCWIFSKKHYGWMIGALVLFILDTLAMAGLFLAVGEVSGIMDALMHIWILYYLITGVSSGAKLANMPAEEPVAVEVSENENAEETTESAAVQEDTRALRRMDTEVKARILLEADAVGRHIVYRRVKRTNELVIGSYVYDEVEMLLETAHELSAYIDGHKIVVGLDSANYSYLEVDGAIVERKIRLV